MNIANKLTILRVLLVPVFLLFLLKDDITYFARETAIFIFVLAALTDALDGYLARKYNLITNFGKFADSIADKVLVCAALVAFVELGLLPAWFVIVIISRDFVISTFRMLAADTGVVIAADGLGKLKTIFQMIMIIYLMFEFEGAAFVLAGNILIAIVLLLTIASAVNYFNKNRAVFKQ